MSTASYFNSSHTNTDQLEDGGHQKFSVLKLVMCLSFHQINKQAEVINQ